MDRVWIVTIAAATAWASAIAAAHAQGPTEVAPTQNVLIVIADDMGIGEVGAYANSSSAPVPGASPGRTPFLDSLAAAGVRFNQAWSNPNCSPTRATVYTGRYSQFTGVGTAIPNSNPGGLGELAESENTLGDYLTPTALFGKWHLGETLFGAAGPLDLGGFDKHSGTIEGDLDNYKRWTRFEDGVQVSGPPVGPYERTYATTQNVNDARDWILAQGANTWLAVVAFNAPHFPSHVPPQNLLHPDTKTLLRTLDPTGPIRTKADCERTSDNRRLCYQAAIEAMDKELARLFSEAGISTADTAVIFMGDNGTDERVADADTSPIGKSKGTVYQNGIRVPLIITSPTVNTPGREVDHPVNTTDVFATALDLAGVAPPVGTDSHSLKPYLDDPAALPQRSSAYSERFDSPGGYVDSHTDPLGMAAYTDGSGLKVIEENGVLTGCYRVFSTDPAVPADHFELTNLLDSVAFPTEYTQCVAIHDALEAGLHARL